MDHGLKGLEKYFTQKKVKFKILNELIYFTE